MMYETSKRRVTFLIFIFLEKSLVIIDFFAVNNDCLVIADIFQSNDPSGERLGKCNIIL